RHGDALWHALQGPDTDPALWDFLPYGPFAERAAFDAWLVENAISSDTLFFAVVNPASGHAMGLLSYLSIEPAHGSIEIGHVAFGRGMQRSPASTEAVYLLAQQAFALGYRRLEWKCNSLNARSRHAAERLGFVYEGLFRQHRVVKGHNRDTAWFALLDGDWPVQQRAFQRWLAEANFDAEGRQHQRLEALRDG
ncbi:GNAT family protein, partial [Pseudomonas sp. RIT-PI-AD]|uniref:GNAT family N-acetyltransferase n=1 Tax=Pseudomonas sp. RIT-PI-AD TaxID=3035294 RepID=UPI0021D7EAA2